MDLGKSGKISLVLIKHANFWLCFNFVQPGPITKPDSHSYLTVYTILLSSLKSPTQQNCIVTFNFMPRPLTDCILNLTKKYVNRQKLNIYIKKIEIKKLIFKKWIFKTNKTESFFKFQIKFFMKLLHTII